MRLTPGYLIAVATFYDMFEHAPGRRAHDLRLHEHLVLDARRRPRATRRCSTPPATTSTSTCARFECLGACDIAPMASVNSVYVGPLELEDCATLIDQLRNGEEPLPDKQLARAPVAKTWWASGEHPEGEPAGGAAPRAHRDQRRGQADGAALQGHRRAGPQHARRLRARAAATRCRPARARHGPGRGARRAAGVRRARPRRRGLRDGQEGVLPAQGRHGQVPRLQRGRVRAGDLQGPRAHAEEPAPADRGRDRLRLRGRRQQRLHLHPRRVRLRRRHPRRRAGRGEGRRPRPRRA